MSFFSAPPGGVVPTERGREFLASARQVVKQVEEMERKYRPGNSDYQSFSISVPRASYISQAFSAFVAALTSAPALELDFMETNSMLAISNVLEGKTNLAIIRYQMSYENYFLRFLEDKGLGPRRHLGISLSRAAVPLPPAGQPVGISAEDLRDYTEITHGDLSIPYLSQAKPSTAVPSAKRIHIYERGSQFDLLTHHTNAYIFVSPMPGDLLQRLDLVQLPCSSNTETYKDVLVYPRSYKFTDLDRQFIQHLYQIRDRLKLSSLGQN